MTALRILLAAGILLLNFFWCEAQRTTCDSRGPDYCSFFGHSLCNWTAYGDKKWYNYTKDTADKVSLGLYNESVLTSRLSCSTENATYCLSFWYDFTVNDKISLNVYVTNAQHPGRLKLWSLSSSDDLREASIPVETFFDFFVEFEGIGLPGYVSQSARLDEVLYRENSSCTFSPASARVSTSDNVSCHQGGPESCLLNGYNPCSWKSDKGWGWYQPSDVKRDTILRLDGTTGLLTSRKACATQPRIDCLSFAFKFDAEHDAVNLKVFVRNATTDHRENIWWLSSPENVGSWNKAKVSVFSDFNFFIEIEATKRPRNGKNASVYINNIDYRRDTPSCGVEPSNAKVSTTFAPTLSTHVVSSTTESTTTNSQPTEANSGDDGDDDDEDNEGEKEDKTSNMGAIYGGIAAAVVVLILVVVLCVLYRKNKLPCFRKQEPKEAFHVKASHNAAYNPDSVGPEESLIAGVNDSTNKHVTHPDNFRQSSGDYYSTIPNEYSEASKSASSASGAYTEVNKPTGFKKPPNSSPQAAEGVYHIPEDSTSKPNPTTDEYNTLDFDKKRKGVQEHTDGEAGAVYSHLREGDEDAYNEVDRERRTDVIGDEYSHLQQK